MPRHTWEQLPADVRGAIEQHCGTVTRVDTPTAGRSSDFSATLHTPTGPVFCKGITEPEHPRAAMHHHEAAINPWLPPTIAPRLRWRVQTDRWLLLGFDHTPGHHADLSPGSSDLSAVATAVTTLHHELADSPAPAPDLAAQWARLSAWRRLADRHTTALDPDTTHRLDELIGWESHGIDAAHGDDLVHTDLHPFNILTSHHHAHVVDWAWSRKGTAHIDVAFLIARLIAAGHPPAHAEHWADTLPAWKALPPPARTAVAVTIWGIWTHVTLNQPRPVADHLAPAAAAWARHRLST